MYVGRFLFFFFLLFFFPADESIQLFRDAFLDRKLIGDPFVVRFIIRMRIDREGNRENETKRDFEF